MIIVNDLRPGVTFEYENNIYSVIETSHNKTAMRQMIVKSKVRNLRTGTIVELSFTGGDKVEPAHIDKKEMQYLYDAGDALVFMDTNTYEQIEIQKSIDNLKIGDRVKIKDSNSVATVEKIEGKSILLNYGQFTAKVSIFDIYKI